MKQSTGEDRKIQAVKEATSFLFHKHYCENDVEAIIKLFDDKMSWFGAGENEYATGTDNISGIFRQFAGMVPKCNIWNEEYHVIDISPDVFICSGRAWIATDPSTGIYLRAHQRITAVFRWADDAPRCCHIHISNPYSEMTQEDVGFPTQIGQYTYEYLNQCIEEYKRKIKEQTEILKKLSFEDSLTGLYNRNKFNHTMQSFEMTAFSQLTISPACSQAKRTASAAMSLRLLTRNRKKAPFRRPSPRCRKIWCKTGSAFLWVYRGDAAAAT